MGNYALKFAIFPVYPNEPGTISGIAKGPNYLQDDMIERLKHGPVNFDFKVQLYTSDKSKPIEDGVVEWSPKDSPFVTVGRLTIPNQEHGFCYWGNMLSCVDKLSFGPWVRHHDFKPIGSLNRARRLVYQASSSYRKS